MCLENGLTPVKNIFSENYYKHIKNILSMF